MNRFLIPSVEPAANMTERSSHTIDATETSLAIFETLTDADGAIGVTALADRVGVSKSVAYNHLSTLRAGGYVLREEDGYRPSLRVLNLGVRVRAKIPVYRAAKRSLDNLAAATDETTTLFVLEGNEGVPTYIAEAADGWCPAFQKGERVPST